MKSSFAATLLGLLAATGATAEPAKPTIVLVHGAFADSSSWNGVIEILERDGFPSSRSRIPCEASPAMRDM